ncbi:MAG: 2-C-methyl-D-erythritol 2,4-cyclodiphosphate synthase [Pseudomonadales bacterium]
MRIGHGFDVHRFGDGDHVTLGGVRIEHNAGLIAHSDGDVVLHALCDALLGAAALGDIGQHFPDTDPRYQNIASTELLQNCYQLVQQKSLELINADISVIAQAPRLQPHITAMRSAIAAALKRSVEQINVKATTTEKLGYIGREEGIAAHAVILLK